MARAYSRFATAAARGDESPKCVVTAMTGHPFLVGGTDRADSMLIEGTGGKVISKVGAEGVHCAMILGRVVYPGSPEPLGWGEENARHCAALRRGVQVRPVTAPATRPPTVTIVPANRIGPKG